MTNISKYTLLDILEDLKDFDNFPDHQYIESIVSVMKWHYEKERFDNDIILKSQAKDMAVMDYILESYKTYLC